MKSWWSGPAGGARSGRPIAGRRARSAGHRALRHHRLSVADPLRQLPVAHDSLAVRPARDADARDLGILGHPGRFVGYLARYADRFSIVPRLGTALEGLVRVADGWVVSTSQGELKAGRVVLATGACTEPHIPAWAAEKASARHSSTPRNTAGPDRTRNAAPSWSAQVTRRPRSRWTWRAAAYRWSNARTKYMQQSHVLLGQPLGVPALHVLGKGAVLAAGVEGSFATPPADITAPAGADREDLPLQPVLVATFDQQVDVAPSSATSRSPSTARAGPSAKPPTRRSPPTRVPRPQSRPRSLGRAGWRSCRPSR